MKRRLSPRVTRAAKRNKRAHTDKTDIHDALEKAIDTGDTKQLKIALSIFKNYSSFDHVRWHHKHPLSRIIEKNWLDGFRVFITEWGVNKPIEHHEDIRTVWRELQQGRLRDEAPAITCLGQAVHSDAEQEKDATRLPFVLDALEAGANVNVSAKLWGWSALMLAYNHADAESMRYLKIFGSDATFTFSDGQTLHNFGIVDSPEGNETARILRTTDDQLFAERNPDEQETIKRIARKRTIHHAAEAHKYGKFHYPVIYAREQFTQGYQAPTDLQSLTWSYLTEIPLSHE